MFCVVYVHANNVGCEHTATKTVSQKVILFSKGFYFKKIQILRVPKADLQMPLGQCRATFKLALLFNSILLEYKVN